MGGGRFEGAKSGILRVLSASAVNFFTAETQRSLSFVFAFRFSNFPKLPSITKD